MGAAPLTQTRARSRPMAALSLLNTSLLASLYCAASANGSGLPEALCAVAAVPTPRAQARSFFFLSSARAILPLMPAWNFSQMRGTAKNTVGRTSLRLSGTFSIDSAK